jgi:excisionase family DNA binding protein
MNTENSRLLLRVGEAAERLSLSRSKTYQLVQAGELPSIRLGRSLRVPVEALAEVIEKLRKEQRG